MRRGEDAASSHPQLFASKPESPKLSTPNRKSVPAIDDRRWTADDRIIVHRPLSIVWRTRIEYVIRCIKAIAWQRSALPFGQAWSSVYKRSSEQQDGAQQ